MDTTDKQKKKPPQKPKAVNTAWVGLITVISFALSVVMSYISNEALASAGTILSFAVLLLFIALGIVFDMIGVASTSATEKEFHSMAAHRVRGAREAVWMVRNAEKVSSICNDVRSEERRVGKECRSRCDRSTHCCTYHLGGECGTQGCGISADYRSGFGTDHRRQGSRQGNRGDVQQQGAGALRTRAVRSAAQAG